jgi:hypothetical protein
MKFKSFKYSFFIKKKSYFRKIMSMTEGIDYDEITHWILAKDISGERYIPWELGSLWRSIRLSLKRIKIERNYIYRDFL